jgi:GNAT superfamily N-acetyltransferase
MATRTTVRRATSADAMPLLRLMRELARFEGYLEQFRVKEEDLLARGLRGGDDAQFTALVAADEAGALSGYAVVYRTPFTYDLRPNLMLKELYVDANARGQGIGHALMEAVIALGRSSGCARLKWDVLTTNAAAKTFYRQLGGAQDERWEGWAMAL